MAYVVFEKTNYYRYILKASDIVIHHEVYSKNWYTDGDMVWTRGYKDKAIPVWEIVRVELGL